ncbi:WYL domain-containing protein [Paludicola sp. MB14-C6]|uniref:helix-turn-helix transcriptional regulator n=1 Tax=Paludihabitans sp. MB14-C6 TaxID=3070656 RepID=UPI0027DD20DF|nr:WYL domain-containing protein [Paludicola sp. MB14-C6]WMJ22906.1 WYL domain-containing protein [Paludicola sp. MB14-C6]
MDVKNNLRILYILKFLYENSDEENQFSTNDIIEYLNIIGIPTHRKTIASDIEQLIEFGIDIITVKSTQNKYFIGNRKFELPELKLLVDAVESSKFITTKKSNELITKLSNLTSKNLAKELNRQLHVEKRIKPNNEQIYYTVDTIHAAINSSKQIEFKYIEYLEDKTQVLKHDGYIYKVSPYYLCWNEDHYYLIGFSDKHNKISSFRADRIVSVNITEVNSIPKPNDFNGADYVRNIFDMFHGETKTVELKCTNDLMKAIIDRFGEEVETTCLGGGHFKAIVEVAVSPTFYGWVFQFGGDISILAPVEVKEQFKEMVRKFYDK